VVGDLFVALTLVVLALHLLGERRARARTGRRRGHRARRRALTFYAGLAAILAAFLPPIGTLSAQLFWALMIQRLLLLTVAAPLIALGRPWISLWRPFPSWLRHPISRAVAQSRACAPLRGLFHALSRAPWAWLAFSINLVLWHLPGPFDLAARSAGVRILEYGTFLLFGILFWIQVTGSSRAAAKVTYSRRTGYVAATMVTNAGLAIYLAFAPHPLYAPYAQLAHRPGGITALADQQIGAGIMWAAGDVPFAIALALLIHSWLAAQDAQVSHLMAGLTADSLPPQTPGS
jgi:putative membrane protein